MPHDLDCLCVDCLYPDHDVGLRDPEHECVVCKQVDCVCIRMSIVSDPTNYEPAAAVVDMAGNVIYPTDCSEEQRRAILSSLAERMGPDKPMLPWRNYVSEYKSVGPSEDEQEFDGLDEPVVVLAHPVGDVGGPVDDDDADDTDLVSDPPGGSD